MQQFDKLQNEEQENIQNLPLFQLTLYRAPQNTLGKGGGGPLLFIVNVKTLQNMINYSFFKALDQGNINIQPF